MNQKLKKLITKKLEKLQEILDKIDEVRVIEPDDPETWDADTLYDLVENSKEALTILEDNAKTSEYGLCSLLEEYQEENEENNEDYE